jgi:hypothetical protein
MSRNVGDRIRLKIMRQDKTLEIVYQVAEAPRQTNQGTNRRGGR